MLSILCNLNLEFLFKRNNKLDRLNKLGSLIAKIAVIIGPKMSFLLPEFGFVFCKMHLRKFMFLNSTLPDDIYFQYLCGFLLYYKIL